MQDWSWDRGHWYGPPQDAYAYVYAANDSTPITDAQLSWVPSNSYDPDHGLDRWWNCGNGQYGMWVYPGTQLVVSAPNYQANYYRTINPVAAPNIALTYIGGWPQTY
jgi:hypothetical protein